MIAKTKVVIIDDNHQIREIMSSLIDMQNDMEIAGSAADGRKGLELIQAVRPDVLQLDMVMPKMDGLSV